MAQIGFIINVPQYKAAQIGSYSALGVEIAKLVAKQVPVNEGVSFVSLATADHVLVVKTVLDIINPTSTNKFLNKVSVAGGAAGSTSVSGAVATSVLLSVFASNDTTHAVTDVTSEWTANAPGAGTFDNTGGSNNTGSHVIFTFYNPPQAESSL